MKRLQSFLVIAALLLVGTGCSDLKKGAVPSQAIESTRFNAGCKLEAGEFEHILERDISFQIDCLGRNLDLFIQVVESNKPGYLSRQAFEEYVIRNVPDFKPESVRAIKAVFDLAHLLFGDDPAFLHPRSVRKIIDFLFLFNREGRRAYSAFDYDQDMPIPVHGIYRDRVNAAITTMANALFAIYQPDRGGDLHSLDITELLEAFSTEQTQDTLNKIKAALFVKKLILGGENDIITHVELGNLISKAAPLLTVTFDLARLSRIRFDAPNTNAQEAQLDILAQDLGVIESVLYYTSDSSERLFSIAELSEAVAAIFDPKTVPDLRKYPCELLQLKLTLTGESKWAKCAPGQICKCDDIVVPDEKKWVHPAELRILIDHLKDIAARGRIYHRIYKFFKTQMESPDPVSIDYANYVLQFPTHEKYVKEFARIVTDYRYFPAPKKIPFYSREFHRSPEGVVQSGFLEYVITILFKRYGVETEKGLGGYGAELDHMKAVFILFRNFLENEGFITKGRATATNQNLTLLTTLFQHQSDGDGVMNVNELTEFGTTVLASFGVADYFQEELNKLCPFDSGNRITDLPCYRRHYFAVMCRKYKDNYPRLFQSLNMPTCDAPGDPAWNARFLKTMEDLARACPRFEKEPKIDVPVSAADYFPINVMMMAIEGTISRYDTNFNNQLDASEVRRAYDTSFKAAVEALVEQQAAIIARLPFNLGGAIARKIYYHLVKYKDIPRNLGQYMRLLTIGPSVARRDTIAAVLKVINSESGKGPPKPGDDPKFDCEVLRDPPDPDRDDEVLMSTEEATAR